jgi:hypothetical protein
METVSDDRTDANSAELAKIELEVIAPLEQGFAKSDALKRSGPAWNQRLNVLQGKRIQSLTMRI